MTYNFILNEEAPVGFYRTKDKEIIWATKEDFRNILKEKCKTLESAVELIDDFSQDLPAGFFMYIENEFKNLPELNQKIKLDGLSLVVSELPISLNSLPIILSDMEKPNITLDSYTNEELIQERALRNLYDKPITLAFLVKQ